MIMHAVRMHGARHFMLCPLFCTAEPTKYTTRTRLSIAVLLMPAYPDPAILAYIGMHPDTCMSERWL